MLKAVTVLLVKHEPGCKWGRFEGEVDARANILSGAVRPGHTDAAKRFSDTYNLHKAAGIVRGWIAIRYSDGSSNGDVYESRGDAVADCWPRENWYFYCTLQQPSMSVCAAEAILRWKRIMSDIERPDREAPNGGLEVIPHGSLDEQERQIEAVRTGRGLLAMGHRRG